MHLSLTVQTRGVHGKLVFPCKTRLRTLWTTPDSYIRRRGLVTARCVAARCPVSPAAIGDLVITCGQGRADGAAPAVLPGTTLGAASQRERGRGNFTHNNIMSFARIHAGREGYSEYYGWRVQKLYHSLMLGIFIHSF